MFQNFIQLFISTTIGTLTTFLNISFTAQMINTHVAILTAFFGLITAVFTCIYLYWQIKKIKNDFKNKKEK